MSAGQAKRVLQYESVIEVMLAPPAGKDDTADLLFESGASVDIFTEAATGADGVVTRILKRVPEIVNARDYKDHMPLYLAMMKVGAGGRANCSARGLIPTAATDCKGLHWGRPQGGAMQRAPQLCRGRGLR